MILSQKYKTRTVRNINIIAYGMTKLLVCDNKISVNLYLIYYGANYIRFRQTATNNISYSDELSIRKYITLLFCNYYYDENYVIVSINEESCEHLPKIIDELNVVYNFTHFELNTNKSNLLDWLKINTKYKWKRIFI